MKPSCHLIVLLCLLGFDHVAGDQDREEHDDHVGDGQEGGVPSPQLSLQTDDNSWMVEGDCLAVKMLAEIKIYPNSSNIFMTPSIPLTAAVSNASSCSFLKSATTQVITLEWSDTDPLSGIPLSRNLSLFFSLNTTSTIPTYGVSKVTSMYELTRYQEVPGNNSSSGQNTTTMEMKPASVSKIIQMTSHTVNPLQFFVPQNRSFMCDVPITVKMTTELLTTDGSPSEKLQMSSLTMKTLQFDAFRPDTLPASQFQPSTPCKTHSSDLVPIVVGCGLAGLVLFIVVCYLVGRRKPKVKGYATVGVVNM